MSKKLQRPEHVKDWLVRRYNNQHRSWLEGLGEWPLRVTLGVPTERDFTDDPREVRSWVEAWSAWQGAGELVWEERKWPRIGVQRLPVSISFAGARDVALWTDQERRWVRASTRFESLVVAWPVLRDRSGLGRHFDILADYSDADFERLLATLGWFLANPASGMYVRQLPIEGIDTKWLEKRTGVVTELLTMLRGDEHRRDFYDACGLRRTPHRIRMRVLCPLLRLDIGGLTDLEVPIEQLAALALRPKAVLIVENQETGLALPDMDGVVALMRLGNSVSTLSGLPWLEGVPAVYWGDIDTHGLAILSRARRALPRIRSVLMDETTLQAHKLLWSMEPSQHPEADLPELTVDERAVFDGLRAGRWGAKLRLEQERLPWNEALAEVERALVLACVPEKSLRHTDAACA